MITPMDIQNKVFNKGVRGYREEEVDSFLDLITLDMEKLIDENAQMKQELAKARAELQRYQGSEGAVLETLEAAKALMSDISASSEKRAEILLKNAELDAELITREAKENVERLKEEAASLENKVSSFRMKYRSLLETELDKLDSLTQELFGDIQSTSAQWKQPESVKTYHEIRHDNKKTDPATRSMSHAEVEDMAKTMLNLRIRED
ncbi:MAG: DivIVA domain-containing protein [Firmicutes bacterium]|nr:DivIVA domain-containing protein [Bacillota bacterium]MBR4074593.1 DivIVA domain-containing protein [Bacillota bacterium]MBR7149069.1 DivIVA domain-containing protein [Bacillota bacterium]